MECKNKCKLISKYLFCFVLFCFSLLYKFCVLEFEKQKESMSQKEYMMKKYSGYKFSEGTFLLLTQTKQIYNYKWNFVYNIVLFLSYFYGRQSVQRLLRLGLESWVLYKSLKLQKTQNWNIKTLTKKT